MWTGTPTGRLRVPELCVRAACIPVMRHFSPLSFGQSFFAQFTARIGYISGSSVCAHMSVSQGGLCRGLCMEHLLTSLLLLRCPRPFLHACGWGGGLTLRMKICNLGRAQPPRPVAVTVEFQSTGVSLRSVFRGSGGGQSASRITSIHCLSQWGNWGRGSQWIRPELQPQCWLTWPVTGLSDLCSVRS